MFWASTCSVPTTAARPSKGTGRLGGSTRTQHVLWIDPRDGRHMIVGTDGGTYVTYDRMDHWDYHNQKAVGQFYHVAIDSEETVSGLRSGLQDNGSPGAA